MSRREIIETDVLCVGGGIAGLMAAIRARELGAKVIVVDKANTSRSGSAGVGNDHFRCYIPEVHGPDIEPFIAGLAHSPVGGMRDMNFARVWMEKSFDIVKLWDSWGIPMKYRGAYEFAGHGFPGRPVATLKYSGREQKPILTREALRRGAIIMNRMMIFDIVHDGGAFKAIGVSTRENRIVEFHAKSAVFGTGLCTRLYPSPTPAWIFNTANSPNNTGDGRAMAFRAGAEIASAELTRRWAGPKYFARCGKGTWVGVLRDREGRPVGPFLTKPDRKYSDMAADIWGNLFEDYGRSGRGPVYMDCQGISDEDFEYMMHWMNHEGNSALFNHLAEEGADIRHTSVEFMTYEMMFSGGIYYNEKAETSQKGLYAAGDEFQGGISCAATFGWIAGENAARYAVEAPGDVPGEANGEIENTETLLRDISNRREGASWQEVNVALQQIMCDYAGPVRSESLLQAGLSHLRRLKKKALTLLMARNQHELMHCLEVINLFDLGELIFIAANERKESRGVHVRADYPYTNPLLNRLLVVKKVNGKTEIEWRTLKSSR